MIGLRLGAVLVAAAALVSYHLYAVRQAATVARAEVVATYTAAAAVVAENDRLLERGWKAKTKGIQRDRTEDLARVERAAADLRSQRDRLLDDLAARDRVLGEATGPAGGFDDATVRGGLLAACAGRYEEVARDAANLASQVRGLQAFVSGVCVAS